MSKYKNVHDSIRKLNDKTTNKKLYEIILLITEENDLKKISGIYKDVFMTQARDYFIRYKRFTDKQRKGIFRTLEVYADNIKRAGKL